ncbi:MAG: hypothetical protein U9N09_05985 [Euryarchaeota archaeon]|nr:hypothetical protein [Euryarchaeota archaeon]
MRGAADIIAQVGRAAAGCDLRRDHGVRGGKFMWLLGVGAYMTGSVSNG